MRCSRRAWLTRSLAVGGTGLLGFSYGYGIEKRQLSLTRLTIPVRPRHQSIDGLKIAVMGDFHHDDFGDEDLIRRAVAAINKEGVDLVCLVGDYISNDALAIVPLSSELKDLRSTLGSFAVFGNHDRIHYDPVLKSSMEGAGIRLLDNTIVSFDRFSVAGLDSFLTRRSNLARVRKELPPEKPALLLWHEPDTFDLYDDPRIALQVSGHSHGGQVCAPFIGPLKLPLFGRKYPYGHYSRRESSLFVTRGIGTLDIPARFLCPPEVAFLTLRA